MRKTEGIQLALYGDILTYASAKIADYGLEACDTLDIVSTAYLKAQRKLARHRVRENINELVKTIAWSETMNTLESRNTRRERMLSEALRLDAPTEGEDAEPGGEESDGLDLSDGGRAAERLCRIDGPENDDPLWLRLFRDQYARERGLARRVLDGLKKTSCREKVRKRIGCSRPDFYKIIKKIQMHFDQCFRAYHAHLADEAQNRIGIHLVNYSREAMTVPAAG